MQAYDTSPIVAQQSIIQQQPQPFTADNNERVFSVRSLKIFGGIQLGIGIIIGLLCIIGIILDASYSGYKCSYFDYFSNSMRYYSCDSGNRSVVFAFDSTCLICSGWVILTGFLPFCMSQNRKSSWPCLKKSFMVCSIIGAVFFVPGIFGLGVTGSFLRMTFDNKTVALSASIAVLSFVEVVVAIVAASYCCCCTQWDTTSQQFYGYFCGPQPFILMMPPHKPKYMVDTSKKKTCNPMSPRQGHTVILSNNITQSTNLTGISQACASQEHHPPPLKE